MVVAHTSAYGFVTRISSDYYQQKDKVEYQLLHFIKDLLFCTKLWWQA